VCSHALIRGTQRDKFRRGAFAAPSEGETMSLLTLAIVLAFAATIYSLVCGVTAMAAGGEVGHHNSEQWMIRRVAFQTLAVALLLVAVMQS
jgi:hypothetical protein